jgi:three-Cys-motif partner protein
MPTTERAEHSFGGGWTEIKLNAVSDYLKFYTTALRASPSPDNPFETWYVDAFAGTGDRTIETANNGLFANGNIVDRPLDRVRLEGSARRALAIDPPFRHLVFIEKDVRRFEALERVKTEFPMRDIQCLLGDANVELRKVFDAGPWIQFGRKGLQRGVVFLDPYGMSVRWDTLLLLAEIRRVC